MKLRFQRQAFEARAHFRQHDEVRSQALEQALDGIRDGTGRDRAIRSGQLASHLTRVVIPGRDEEDVIVWALEPDGHATIIYVGSLNVR